MTLTAQDLIELSDVAIGAAKEAGHMINDYASRDIVVKDKTADEGAGARLAGP